MKKISTKVDDDYWYWFEVRLKLLNRDKCCGYCGIVLQKHNVTIDHIIPKAKGGDDSYSNMIACCKKCNHQKADKTALEFFFEV